MHRTLALALPPQLSLSPSLKASENAKLKIGREASLKLFTDFWHKLKIIEKQKRKTQRQATCQKQ